MTVMVSVKNVPKDALRYIVARWSQETNELWYWGSWDDLFEAAKVAEEIDGILTERINYGVVQGAKV